jgi:Fanconi anemia group M protein
MERRILRIKIKRNLKEGRENFFKMPLFNIFKTLKSRNQEQRNKKPIILADIHEKNSSVLANLEQLGAEIHIANLKVGDYLTSNIIIERKTFQDFISSMLSKRLIQQLKNMLQYEKRLFILEGNLKISQENSRFNLNALKGMLLTISLDFNIPIIQTKDEQETSLYLFLLAKRQLKPPAELTLHSRIPKTKKEQMKYILESFPGIGPKTSEKLLKEFKTIKNIINANEKSLKEIIGKRALTLKQLSEQEY